jgi:short-subunit dehydrogenase
VLITASVASTTPTPFAAVYGATKAFDLSFAEALHNELGQHGITVTALQPAATATNFFKRAHMLDTRVAAGKKDDAALVARQGFAAMMAGRASVLGGALKSRMGGALNELLPETIKATLAGREHRPGSAIKR